MLKKDRPEFKLRGVTTKHLTKISSKTNDHHIPSLLKIPSGAGLPQSPGKLRVQVLETI